MTKAKCPHCGLIIDHFEKVGEENAVERCPECHNDIDINTIEKIEEVTDEAHPQEDK